MNQNENIKKEYAYAEFLMSRSPKENHDKLKQLENKSADRFRKEGILYDLYLLSNNTSWEGFTNISKTLSANPDEDV
ncbi:MAG: hypothetical protein H0X03_03535 [Nitrosopumilus sp.]|nr:hypothetical protein [Nitrosopumilus sp.]